MFYGLLWKPVTHLPSEQNSNGQIFGHISRLNPGVDISDQKGPVLSDI